jgi:30S ribosomal protein S31
MRELQPGNDKLSTTIPKLVNLPPNSKTSTIMGRGDKKTKKGKIFKGSFGKSRPATEKKTTGNQPAVAAEKKA